MSDDKHPAHQFQPEGDTDETTITERFERGEGKLIEAMDAVRSLGEPDSPILRSIGEGLYDLSRIRRELRGCWTDEAKQLRNQTMRLRAVTAEGRARSMHGAIDSALPALRDVITELTDRPVLRALLEQVADDLGGSRLELVGKFRSLLIGNMSDIEEIGSRIRAAISFPVLRTSATLTLASGTTEIGERTELLRRVADNMDHLDAPHLVCTKPGDAGRLRAFADELDNAEPLEPLSEADRAYAAEYVGVRCKITRLWEEHEAVEGDDPEQVQRRAQLADEAQGKTIDLQHQALSDIARGRGDAKAIAIAAAGLAPVE